MCSIAATFNSGSFLITILYPRPYGFCLSQYGTGCCSFGVTEVYDFSCFQTDFGQNCTVLVKIVFTNFEKISKARN